MFQTAAHLLTIQEQTNVECHNDLSHLVTVAAIGAVARGAFVIDAEFDQEMVSDIVGYTQTACDSQLMSNGSKSIFGNHTFVAGLGKSRHDIQKSANKYPDLNSTLIAGIARSFDNIRHHGSKKLRPVIGVNRSTPQTESNTRLHDDASFDVAVVICPDPFRVVTRKTIGNFSTSQDVKSEEKLELSSGIIGVRGPGRRLFSARSIWHAFENTTPDQPRHSIVVSATKFRI